MSMIDNYGDSVIEMFPLSNFDYGLHTNKYTVDGKCVNIWKMLTDFFKNDTDSILNPFYIHELE